MAAEDVEMVIRLLCNFTCLFEQYEMEIQNVKSKSQIGLVKTKGKNHAVITDVEVKTSCQEAYRMATLYGRTYTSNNTSFTLGRLCSGEPFLKNVTL